MSELRWNPLLEEWVVTATHRQDRTFRPAVDYCPLCPTSDPRYPTEVPAPCYEVVVFENKFPSFRREPETPTVSSTELLLAAPSRGICEVVLYTDDHDATFAELPLERIEGLVDVWADRYEELGSREYVDYVLIFENKGEIVGVTLDHPHGQIYAFPFIPPRVGKELEASSKHMAATGRCIFCDLMAEELRDGRRLISETRDFVAFVPFFARYPYEVHVMPRAHVASLSDLDAGGRRGLARILKDVTAGYDSLFGFSFPYMMIIHQAPTDGGTYNHYHLHVEFYPPHRTRDKIKYLAGCESGAGTFINDSLPEEKAAELREAIRQAAAMNAPAHVNRSKRDGGGA
ncbi:MAG: galactose-1-phosphate uridylyltransferase [Trueperella sp.]|nr:galactose-1-phosphate uridylyltransferase [Trueperella sp.]